MKKLLNEEYKNLVVHVLSPVQANILKLNNNFRYKIVIKYKQRKLFNIFLKDTVKKFSKDVNFSGVNFYPEINPNYII